MVGYHLAVHQVNVVEELGVPVQVEIGATVVVLVGHPAIDIDAGVDVAIHVLVYQRRVLLQDQGFGGTGGRAGDEGLQFGIGFHAAVLSA